jgi:hypothetical protein
MYHIHAKCFDCVVKMETKMRFDGTYAEYARKFITGNVLHFVNEARDIIKDFKKVDDHIYTEQGDKQEFVGGIDKEKVSDKWIEELDEIEKNIKSQIP